jgi:hypothetical protein
MISYIRIPKDIYGDDIELNQKKLAMSAINFSEPYEVSKLNYAQYIYI